MKEIKEDNIQQQIEQQIKQKAETQVNNGRRKALVAGVAGAAAGAAWHKPMINSVVTPAHAQTTTGMDDDDSSGDDMMLADGDTFVLDPPLTSNNSPFNPLSLIINNANAGDIGTPARESLMKLTYVAATESFDYEQVNRNGNQKRVASGLTEGVEVTTTVIESCRDRDTTHYVTIADIAEAGITLLLRAVDNDNSDNFGDNTFFLEPGDYPVETECEAR